MPKRTNQSKSKSKSNKSGNYRKGISFKKRAKKKTIIPFGKEYKEYRLVLFLGTTKRKHQGPRLCSPQRSKLYFSPHTRSILSIWCHNSHLLLPNHKKEIVGYTNKNIAHSVTFAMVRSQIASMLSTAESNDADLKAKMSLNTSLNTDTSIATSTKIEQLSPNTPNIQHKTIPLLDPNELSNELSNELFGVTWGTWDIGDVI